ncbi:unnamed protein product [Rotaria sordida]|uniref:Uncharacterized protein n=2 Tax=Rotaria sordida TaxID=392033 RepID=A0A815ML96_9BILA|nr:unnamed protein product [Rotaria sordida]
MTCSCGHYDYVDSTVKTLADAMAYHREHGNRIIHETLTGSLLNRGSPLDPDEQKKEKANKMRLYQHSARCPVALHTFLDCNPDYWCFVPLCCNETSDDNGTYFHRNPIGGDSEIVYVMGLNATDTGRAAQYLDHVPKPADVPDDRSIILRYIIKTLFIIHGETKLNMICPVGTDVEQCYGLPYKLDWYANLNLLSMSHTTSNQ